MQKGTEVTIIPRKVRVFRAIYANLPITGIKAEDLGYATDRRVFYRWSGTAWEALTIYSGSGVAADIPAAADLPEGSLYYETDTTLSKQVQSGAWVTILTPYSHPATVQCDAPTIVTGSYSGNETARQITTGFKCSMVIIFTPSGISGTEQHSIIPNFAFRHLTVGTYHGDISSSLSLHATDGFALPASAIANKSGSTYYYWAISE